MFFCRVSSCCSYCFRSWSSDVSWFIRSVLSRISAVSSSFASLIRVCTTQVHVIQTSIVFTLHARLLTSKQADTKYSLPTALCKFYGTGQKKIMGQDKPHFVLCRQTLLPVREINPKACVLVILNQFIQHDRDSNHGPTGNPLKYITHWVWLWLWQCGQRSSETMILQF